jgi:uncharacterized protein
MAIEGTLQEMDLATVLQMVSQRGSAPACILLQRDKERAVLYVEGHMVSHAEMAIPTETGLQTRTGEEVFYELLKWHTGTFAIKRDITPYQRTVNQSWDFLLMEGMRRLDEHGRETDHLDSHDHAHNHEQNSDDVLNMLSTLSPADADAIRELIASQKENDTMSKSDQLRSILNDLVTNSTDIVGAAVVDNDGLLLASAFSGNIDGNRVAAVSAGLISLSSRSAQQLNQGAVKQTLIQAENGNVIAIRANENASFVGLTAINVNLGMVFMECRDAAQAVAKTL